MLRTIAAVAVAALALGQGEVRAQQTAAQADLVALNYALTLEHLEANFYAAFANFSVADYTAAGYTAAVKANINLVAAHEAAHVTALTKTISDLGGTPVQKCTYNLTSVTGVASFLKTAQVLENTGVSAYDGAVKSLTDAGLQQVAATIATVEARHASYLDDVLGDPFTSSPLDTAKEPSAILAAAGGFFVSCPTAPVAPTLRPGAISQASNTVDPVPPATRKSGPYTDAMRLKDLTVLNYALTLEYLEAAFYAYGQGRFSQADFTAAGLPSDAYVNFNFIAAHEAAHVTALTQTINDYGGTPAQKCTYNFTMASSAKSYVAVAKALENTGVGAYDAALNILTDYGLQQVAATIATIEARHAAYLNTLEGSEAPFPSSFDEPLTATQVIQRAASFFMNCPAQLQLPGTNTFVTLAPPSGGAAGTNFNIGIIAFISMLSLVAIMMA